MAIWRSPRAWPWSWTTSGRSKPQRPRSVLDLSASSAGNPAVRADENHDGWSALEADSCPPCYDKYSDKSETKNRTGARHNRENGKVNPRLTVPCGIKKDPLRLSGPCIEGGRDAYVYNSSIISATSRIQRFAFPFLKFYYRKWEKSRVRLERAGASDSK